MDLFFLVLIGYLIYKNSIIARVKGKNAFIWGLLTFIAIFFAEALGMLMLVSFFYPQYIGVADVSKSRELADIISGNFLHSLFVLFCGLGGYLLVRFILERTKGNITPDA